MSLDRREFLTAAAGLAAAGLVPNGRGASVAFAEAPDPNDPNDTYDLNEPYIECRKSSAPIFHYILNDIITVEK